MIKPFNLRINNFVNFKDRTDIDFCDVRSLDSNGYIHLIRYFKDGSIDDQPENINDITGIKLTPEWVSRFGILVKDDNPKQKLHYQGDVLFNLLGFEFSNSSRDGFYSYEINNGDTVFQYVHELQNFYYSVNLKELEFNYEGYDI